MATVSDEKHGPYGSTSPPNWSIVIDSKQSVKEVLIYSGYIVDGISLVLVDSVGKTMIKSSGGQGGSMSKVTLKQGEYITQISGINGIYLGNPTIGMLKIHTNLYPSGYGPFGEAKGVSRPQSFTCPISAENDSWIVELFGTHGPSYLASIGVTTRKGNDICGPYGSRNATNWSMVLDANESIKEVIIRHGYIVDGIGFVVADKNGNTTTKLYGGQGGSATNLTLKPNEYITLLSGIHAKYYNNPAIASLKIHTNISPSGYGPYGLAKNVSEPFNFLTPFLPEDHRIVEFFGREDGPNLQSLGVRIAMQTKQEENIPKNTTNDSNQEENNCNNDDTNSQRRGSIAFFATYRPPVALDIYTSNCPPTSPKDESLMTDGKDYNYNGHIIPPAALKLMLKRPLLAPHGTDVDVDSGRLTGLIFVSERTNSLETLHIGLFHQGKEAKVFSFADVYGTYKGVRLEDSGCFAGDYLVYVSTMEPVSEPHQPWTAVYKTNLKTGETERLTLKGQADLSPSVSPDGKKIAVASFQRKAGWDGEIEDLKTSIFVMNVERPLERKLVVVDGGWPTWGSNNVLFFHRNIEKVEIVKKWGVFRVDLRDPKLVTRVTPEEINAMTPAAIDENRVVVATVRKTFTFADQYEREPNQYRHIEIFDVTKPKDQYVEVTMKTRPMADHFNPFVINDNKVGYHRCNTDKVNAYDVVDKDFYTLQSPDPEVGIFRVSGVFPSISECGTKLAFVDNEFKAVWVADKTGLHMVYKKNDSNSLFSPVWSRGKDILYVCVGPSFNFKETVQILAITNVSGSKREIRYLTNRGYNSAFPATNADGTKLVYRSTKHGPKNLYIMEDAVLGEFDGAKVTRLTEGDWTDTHCQWSPTQDWIVFASNRANPTAPTPKDLPDPGYFGVYMVKATDKNVIVKVIDSGNLYAGGLFPGHVNHPFFSPDGKSLVVTGDLAAVSCDPVSLPLFVHSVRPYGDIFVLDIDPDDIYKNENVTKFSRLTHSKYENSTATWTMASTKDLHEKWNVRIAGNDEARSYQPECPYVQKGGGESFHMTGHLCIVDKRCC
ncbi:uncharacterized protein LOC130818353 [Amaranthus tricolor]|uniref:uncharacterized protein LOC130818353 n=1 Tax=Amaranthus tricolor TaxID=29722 RepID=UPI0025856BEF|nr:uncharacterized protein LOC130818353 [Amaranthus tricolor]